MWGAEGSKPPIMSTTLPPNFMQNHRHRRCVPVDTQDFKAAFRWITVSSYHLDLNGPLAAQWVQRHFASHWQCDLLNHIVVVTAGRVPRSCFWTVNGSHDFSCIFCKIISVGKGRPVCNTSILTPQLTGCSEFLLISDFDLASLGWLDQWKLAIRRKIYGSSLQRGLSSYSKRQQWTLCYPHAVRQSEKGLRRKLNCCLQSWARICPRSPTQLWNWLTPRALLGVTKGGMASPEKRDQVPRHERNPTRNMMNVIEIKKWGLALSLAAKTAAT